MSATVHPSGGAGGGGGGGGSGSGNGGGGPCGACKFLRRKCVAGCIFAPYFDSDQGAAHFSAVHKVFGASNVSKLLVHIPVHRRMDAVVTVCYEAQARLRDPVYGCVSHILSLQQQVVSLQAEVSYLHAHLTSLQIPMPPPPTPMMASPHLSISDLPPLSAFDLSSVFDPMATTPPSWSTQAHRPVVLDPRHYWGNPIASTSAGGGGGGDLQAMARQLLHRQGTGSGSHGQHNDHLTPSSSMAK